MRGPVSLVALVSACSLAFACAGCPPPSPQPAPQDGSQDASGAVDGETPQDAAQDAPTPAQDAAQADSGEDLDAARHPKCTAACLALAKIPECRGEAAGVPGGQSCYEVCAHAEDTRKFDFKAGCLSAAKTVEAARACGTVRCMALKVAVDAGQVRVRP